MCAHNIIVNFSKKFALNKLACTNTSSKVELKSIQLIHELMFQAGVKGMSERIY